jgi:hypothetical protein
MSPWLSLFGVGNMKFDDWAFVGGKGVMQCPRIVSEGARINHDGGGAVAGGMDGINQVTLVVALYVL